MARLSAKDIKKIEATLTTLESRGQEVLEAAEALRSAAVSDRAAPERDFNDALGAWKSEAARLEEFGADGGFSVADFLEQVGEGMVAGQQALDQQTQRYLAKLPEHTQPTTFRIPRLKAELHFAMETSVKKKLNVFMYGRSREDRASQQHKVDFDIVAAPPPPAILEQLAGIPLTGAVVTNLLERQAVLERVDALQKMSSSDQETANVISTAKTLLGREPETIVLAGTKDYILVLPLKGVAKLHMLSLAKSDSTSPVARRAVVEFRAEEAILVDWLREVAGKQAEFFAAHRSSDA